MTQPTSDIKPHGLIAKIFHWGFIVVFAYALTKQLDNVTQLEDAALLRFEVIFALAFLALLGLRFVYMRMTRPTALPENTSPMVKMMARAGHLAMYGGLAMIAISGLMIAAAYSLGGPEGFGMGIALGLHEVSVLASYLTIGLHVVAALYHRLKGDGIWSAMVPFWKEPSS